MSIAPSKSDSCAVENYSLSNAKDVSPGFTKREELVLERPGMLQWRYHLGATFLLLRLNLGLLFISMSTTVLSLVRRGILEFISKVLRPKRWMPYTLGFRTIRLENPKKLHMFFGVMFTFWSFWHTIAALVRVYIPNKYNKSSTNKAASRDLVRRHAQGHGVISDTQYLITGIVALALLTILVSTSIKIVRTRMYELFYFTHYLFIAVVIASFMHIGHVDVFWVVSCSIYALNRFLNFASINKSSLDNVSFIPRGQGTFEIQIPKKKQLIRVSDMGSVFPSKYWHPFDLFDSDDSSKDYLTLLISIKGKWTRDLCEIFSEQSRIGSSEPEKGASKYSLLVSREFATPTSYIYENEAAILIAGGAGISPILSIVNAYITDVKKITPKSKLKDIHLVWIFNQFGQFEILEDFLKGIESLNVLKLMKISLYYTGIISDMSEKEKEITQFNKNGFRIDIEYYRPDIYDIYNSIIPTFSPKAQIGISAIGSESLTTYAKRMSTKWNISHILKYKVNYYNGTF
ncbi:hypothetical protein BB560_001526 [Smittium megazygosporum]|uniref:FAD-binding FR-type domain-containing protein n=1 Tax=Smittium megazygosporum TaxID=133381 RepID=A0A2T9ZHC4_9FUNG|nr:hypothetical protein BB560_001526 [Smittium megazygosporum]